MASPPTVSERKALGAFYTDDALVRVLVEWGLRRPGRAVMDPSCGDGRFLALAGKLGATRLVGCDISPGAAEATRLNLAGGACAVEVVTSDFFALEPGTMEPVDVVVGNPPFIRYQRFGGESRRRALRSALRIGVRLSQLTSSWAPFLLHAVQFLRPGGDLATVVPAEILQTNYGLATLRALLRRFASVSLYAFEQNLFADAQEDTCLLLAENLGGACDQVFLVPLVSAADLAGGFTNGPTGGQGVFPLAEANLVHFAEAFLRPAERRAWRRARRNPAVRSLASLASVTNGYVSGDNDFFHRRLDDALAAGYPLTWLFPIARSARSLQGLSFTREDVGAQEEKGVAHHLLVPQDDLFASDPALLARFVREGESRGTPHRYKCRVRDPWWRVPGLVRGDVLVGYMAGTRPKAAVNRAGAFFSNSLHGLKMNDAVPPDLLVLGLHSSLSLLSLEMEGRSYGGGVLKVEPRELDRVLVPRPDVRASKLREWISQVDPMLREGRYEDAVREVDRLVLGLGMGLSKTTIEQLRTARRRLVERRTNRSTKRRHGSRR
jgi:predicted RNA methylase